MITDHHIARSADQLGFDVPKVKKPGTVPMCVPCRQSKRKCSYTKNNTYPEACLSCVERGKECSEPRLKSRAKRPDTSHKGRYNAAYQASMLPNNTPLPSAFEDTANVSCKRAIILLTLDEILSTCGEELVDLTTDLMRNFQRDPQRENGEDDIPELSAALNELNRVSQIVNHELEKAACVAKGTTLFLAQNALRTHHFRSDLSWGVDYNAVVQCRRSIHQFVYMGHTSLAYVLQTRLLRKNIRLSEADLKNMIQWRYQFMAEVDAIIKATLSKFSNCQMFVPKELVRIPAFADAINVDGRPDYLGRTVTQIRLDAGLASKWSSNDVHYRDILGRTVLHQSLHRQCDFVINKLPTLRADLAQRCMNRLSPLHIAASQGHIEVVKELIRLRPDIVNETDAAGRTAVWHAARASQFGVMDVMSLRRDVNVDIDCMDNSGFSPAQSAVRDGRFEVLNCLIKIDSKRMDARSSLKAEGSIDHEPLLLFASSIGRTECVNLLLRRDVRTWKVGSPEHRDLLEKAKRRGDTKLEGTLYSLSDKFDVQTQETLADATKGLLESESARRAVPSMYPYSLHPHALTFTHDGITENEFHKN